jgi:hypothetical protein
MARRLLAERAALHGGVGGERHDGTPRTGPRRRRTRRRRTHGSAASSRAVSRCTTSGACAEGPAGHRASTRDTSCPPKPNDVDSATRGRACGAGRPDGVDVGLVVRVVEVADRGDDAGAQRQHGRDGLDGAGGAEQVAGAGLGGGHRRAVRAERRRQRTRLGQVAERRRRGVRVDVTDLVRGHAGVAQGRRDAAGRTRAGRVGRGDVVGVAGQTGTGQPGVHPGTAGGGVLLGLQDQDAGALAEHEAVAALVVRAAGGGGLVVAGGQRPHLREAGQRQRVDAASAPPATTTSARPSRSISRPSRGPRRRRRTR